MELTQIEARLARRFPELEIATLRLVHVGFGSVVVETRGGAIFRIARTNRAAAGHARESALLPQLLGRLPVAVPEPRWRVEPGDEFEFGAIGYPKLPGVPRAPDDAADVGLFLAALHRLDVHAPRADDDLKSLGDATLPALQRVLSDDELERIGRWWDRVLDDAHLREYARVLRHGDLWYENLLSADGRLVAVVDWEAAGLGDAAEDFAALQYLGEQFVAGALAAYGPVDASLPHRIERRRELRELYGVRHAVELGDEAELRDAVRKLRSGPILSNRTRE